MKITMIPLMIHLRSWIISRYSLFFCLHATVILNPVQAQNLSANLESGMQENSTLIAYITRPSDREYQRVDRLDVDRQSLAVRSRTPTDMGCDRVHVAGNAQILCFTRITPQKPKYYTAPTAYIYTHGAAMPHRLYQIKGTVSRARMAADGRYAATTAFTTGHSYLGVGGTHFSTSTSITSLGSTANSEDIQKWPIQHQGREVTSIDLNLWGVSFNPQDSDRFVVTAYFDGRPYLAEGRVSQRRIQTLAADVE